MYEAKIENSGGEILPLTRSEKRWQLFDVGGLDPPKATVNLTNLAGMDGALFNSAMVNTRNLVISLKITGDIEANRLELYRFFRPKHACTFYFKNKRRDVKIKGVVESVECPQFTNKEIMQVSILCPAPYFQDIEEIVADMSDSSAGFSFPFSINIGDPIPFSEYTIRKQTSVINASETDVGVLFEVFFLASASRVVIVNIGTGETMEASYSFLPGDTLKISTETGNKKVTLVRGGVARNLFLALSDDSVFLQLEPGNNTFSYLVDDGANDQSVTVTLRFRELYAGV